MEAASVETQTGILVCGNMVADMLVRPVDQIRWNATTWVESISPSIGGNGANTAFAAARLGARVALVSMAGADQFGDELVATLAREGVDTTAIARGAQPTPVTVALVRSDGARAFLHRPGASAEAFAEPPTLALTHARFHLANPFGLPHMRVHAGLVMRRAAELGFKTSLDTGWDSRGEWMRAIEPCLRHTHVFFANEQEACTLTGCADAASAARALVAAGAGAAVIKRGADGCTLTTADEHLECAGFAIDVVDTTGAGDSFVGGFLAALERGMDYAQAARMANAAGALSASALGSVAGLRNFEDTVRFIASKQV